MSADRRRTDRSVAVGLRCWPTAAADSAVRTSSLSCYPFAGTGSAGSVAASVWRVRKSAVPAVKSIDAVTRSPEVAVCVFGRAVSGLAGTFSRCDRVRCSRWW